MQVIMVSLQNSLNVLVTIALLLNALGVIDFVLRNHKKNSTRFTSGHRSGQQVISMANTSIKTIFKAVP